MDKLIYEEITFEKWLKNNKEDIQKYLNITSSKLDPKMDQSAQYIAISDNLCDIKQDVCTLLNESEQFYREWLAIRTEELSEMKGFKGKSPKTMLDFAKNENSLQGVIYKKIEAILRTIEFVGSQLQSKLKFYKP